MSGAGSRAVAAGSVHARFGRFRRPAGAHGWNVNESWPGPCGSGIPSTPPFTGGLERGSGRDADRVHGTLLGPETTGPHAFPTPLCRPAARGFRVGVGSVFRFVPRMASARRSPSPVFPVVGGGVRWVRRGCCLGTA